MAKKPTTQKSTEEFVDLLEDQAKHANLGGKSDEELGLIVQAAANLIQRARYYVAQRNPQPAPPSMQSGLAQSPVPSAPKTKESK